MPDDLLIDPSTFRASGREELPNIAAFLVTPVILYGSLVLAQGAAPIKALAILIGILGLLPTVIHIRRLVICYRMTESHLVIPKWIGSLSVPLDGLKLVHDPKLAWYPGRMTVRSDALPAPGVFCLPDSWVNGEPERERFLQALAVRGVELDLPGFRRRSESGIERVSGASSRLPNSWERGGAWMVSWAVAISLYYILIKATGSSYVMPVLLACFGAGLYFSAYQRRMRAVGDVVFEGDGVSLVRSQEVIWRRDLSDCEAVHCYYHWPAQMPRRKLILRANSDEHLPLTAWQIAEDDTWLELCEILRSKGCRILIEEADDHEVPHSDE